MEFLFLTFDLTKVSSELMNENLRNNMKKRGTGLSELIAENLINPLYNNDIAEIDSLVSNVKQNQNILYVCVYDSDGKIIEEEPDNLNDINNLNIENFVMNPIENRKLKILDINNKVLDIYYPISLDDLHLGGIKIGLSLDDINQNITLMENKLTSIKDSSLNKFIFLIFFTALLMIIVGIIMSFKVSAYLINPIKEVSRYAVKIGQRNYDFQMSYKSEDEIGELVDAFNDMKAELQKNTISIDELEKQVNQRTREIENVNEVLKKYQGQLEKLVSERTAELIESNKQLKIEIDEREKIQQKLIRAQKMEAIGTLSAGVAHDLNNILSGIVSYPDLMLLKLSDDSPLRDSLLAIKKSGMNAAAVVQDLLTLARRGITLTVIVDLKQIVVDYLNSPEHQKLLEYFPAVQVNTHFKEDLLKIFGSPVHLSKTIMNLITNAAEALPDGGTIDISLKNLYVDISIDDYDYIKKGDYIILTIADSGEGIPKEDIERIFEPFYTKKIMGRSGSGLGLAVVWSTVKDHKGYIDVKSKIGEGTTFSIYFPATREIHQLEDTKLELNDYRGNGEKILVVDDVEEQRKLACNILNELGYEASSMENGREAVDYLKEHTVDLIVLDMIMEPDFDGLDTYKSILEINPHQKAIIASGYTESDRVKEAQNLGVGAYVKKPYTVDNIGVTLKNVLS